MGGVNLSMREIFELGFHIYVEAQQARKGVLAQERIGIKILKTASRSQEIARS